MEEYWRFYPRFIGLKDLEKIFQKRSLQIKKGRVVGQGNKGFLAETLRRAKISEAKLAKRIGLIKLLGRLPGVEFIGVSGTVSVLSANFEDDIDLFVTTQKNRLWTARFWLIFITSILRVRRVRKEKNPQDKLCLNLFFDEGNLQIPKKKQTEYVAHEVLQLLPVVNKKGVYERFLEVNRWVYKFFPNGKNSVASSKQQVARKNNLEFNSQFRIGKRICLPLTKLRQYVEAKWGKLKIENLWEFCLKNLQLILIKRHQTTEIITDKQLWFFPEDFERKLKTRISANKSYANKRK